MYLLLSGVWRGRLQVLGGILSCGFLPHEYSRRVIRIIMALPRREQKGTMVVFYYQKGGFHPIIKTLKPTRERELGVFGSKSFLMADVIGVALHKEDMVSW